MCILNLNSRLILLNCFLDCYPDRKFNSFDLTSQMCSGICKSPSSFSSRTLTKHDGRICIPRFYLVHINPYSRCSKSTMSVADTRFHKSREPKATAQSLLIKREESTFLMRPTVTQDDFERKLRFFSLSQCFPNSTSKYKTIITLFLRVLKLFMLEIANLLYCNN